MKEPRADPDETAIESPSKDEVAHWIARTGYPLELRVARILRKCGYDRVGVSEYYREHGGEYDRECDVRGTFDIQLTQTGGLTEAPPENPPDGKQIDAGRASLPSRIVRVTLVIECKFIQANPWIVLVSSRDMNLRTLIAGFPSNELGRVTLDTLFGEGGEPSWVSTLAPIDIGHRVVTYVQAAKDPRPKAEEGGPTRRDKENAGFSAVQSAVRAARVRASEGEGANFGGTAAEIVLPVVVVDGDLYEFGLKGKSVDLKPVKRAYLVRTKWGPPSEVTVVHLMREGALASFAKEQKVMWEAMVRSSISAIDSALQERERVIETR